MALVQTLQALKEGDRCPFSNYFTSNGSVFVMTQGWDRPLAVDVGSTPDDIRQMCADPQQHSRKGKVTKVLENKHTDQKRLWNVASNRKTTGRVHVRCSQALMGGTDILSHRLQHHCRDRIPLPLPCRARDSRSRLLVILLLMQTTCRIRMGMVWEVGQIEW